MSRVTDCGYRDHTLPVWNGNHTLPQDIIGICDCGLVRYVLEGDSWVKYDVYDRAAKKIVLDEWAGSPR